jgi:hypothetical protein
MFPDAITIGDALANAQRGIAAERPAIMRPFRDTSAITARHLQTMRARAEELSQQIEREKAFAIECQEALGGSFAEYEVQPEHLQELAALADFVEQRLQETAGFLDELATANKRQMKEFRRYLSPTEFKELEGEVARLGQLLRQEWDVRSDFAMFLRGIYVEYSEDLSKAPVFDNPDELAAFLDRAVG